MIAALLLAAATGAAPLPDSAATRPTRRDAAYALAATGGVAWMAVRDRNFSGVARHNDTRFALDLAADARRLGDAPSVLVALLATDAGARLAGRRGLAAATERVGLAVFAAGVVTEAIKLSAGRERPDESPDDAARFRPFSGHDAFPSGHTTTAFALAAAIDAETASRWVPAIAYPLAATTGWSRVRDGRHWPSDVVAGAALSSWIAHRTDHALRRRAPLGVWPFFGRDGALGVAARWH